MADQKRSFNWARPALVAIALGVALSLAACGGDDDGEGEAADSSSNEASSEAGSDDAAPAEEADPSDTAEESAEQDAPADEEEQPAGDVAVGANRAIVTIGDQTYEADLGADFAVCISMGGAIGGAGPIDGVEDGSLNIDIPPEDYETSDDGWEPPSIRVDLGEDSEGVPIDWRAGGGVVEGDPAFEGKSQVDSFTVDGSSASGTATFIDSFQVLLAGGGQVEAPEPVSGTFEISCG